MHYTDFLKSRYNNPPVTSAKKPFSFPRSCVFAIIFDSCSQEKTANIMPKEEMKSQISFFINILLFTVDFNSLNIVNYILLLIL